MNRRRMVEMRAKAVSEPPESGWEECGNRKKKRNEDGYES